MNKYFKKCYDGRMGGEYCEIFNEKLERVDIIKGAAEIEGLQQIEKRGSIISALYETEDIGSGYVLLKNRIDGAAPVAAEALI